LQYQIREKKNFFACLMIQTSIKVYQLAKRLENFE